MLQQRIEALDSLRQKWTKCMEDKNYAEAILYLSDAIQQKSDLYEAYEQRSIAFQHMQQYYFALEDARQLITLNSRLAKSHLRKAEIELATENYRDAVETYRVMNKLALPVSTELSSKIRQCKIRLLSQETSDHQLVWVGAAMGLLFGIILVTIDFIQYTSDGYLFHPVFKVAAIAAAAILFYHLAGMHRKYVIRSRKDLLKRPIELDLGIKLDMKLE